MHYRPIFSYNEYDCVIKPFCIVAKCIYINTLYQLFSFYNLRYKVAAYILLKSCPVKEQ